GLDEEVQLLGDGALELAHERDGVVDPDLRDRRLAKPREVVHEREVAPNLRLDAGPLYFHGDFAPVMQRGAVYLRDRRGRKRLVVERREQLVTWLPERHFDLGFHLVGRERGHRV